MSKFKVGDKVILDMTQSINEKIYMNGVSPNRVYTVTSVDFQFLGVDASPYRWHEDRFKLADKLPSIVSVFRNRFLEIE